MSDSSFYTIKVGDRRRHEDIGPVKIFEVKGDKGYMVAVALGLHGEAIDVYSLSNLDPLGWSRIRRSPSSISQEEKLRAIQLKKEGKSSRAIAEEMGVSRAAIQRLTQSTSKEVNNKLISRRLNEIEIKKIRRLLKRDWRVQTIADQMGVSPETVRQIQEKMRSEQHVRALS